MIVMSLPITNGLVGWYKGEAWNGTSWPDLSGNGNDCTLTRGTINKSDRYIYGGTGDGIRFPGGILPSTYTLFHVARYNGSIKGRIFDGTAGNWLSGFHGNKTGVAFHGYWLTQASATNFPLDEILISADQRDLYRGNGIDLKINSGTSQSRTIGINYGSRNGITGTEQSDWAVWEVIVYNRELSLEEIETVENYLNKTYYTYTNPVVPRGVNYFNPRDIVFYKRPGSYQFINQMTGNTTSIPRFGDVVASASSTLNSSEDQWKAFNGTPLSDYWHSSNTYSNGTYTGSASLGGYPGEWLKIEFPVAVFLNYSVLYARSGYNQRLVKTGYLLASNDNTNWSVVQYINRTPEAYTETSFVLVDKYIQKPFKYYAVVVSAIFSDISTQISEWYMDVKVPEFQISNPLYPYDYVFYYGLQAYLDANNTQSYPGSGDTWYDISGNGRHGTWTTAKFNAGGYFDTTSVLCTGPASNSFGITDTSGYTIFITWYQYSLVQSSAFKFYNTTDTQYFRGIFGHCTWNNGKVYLDQGWILPGGPTPRVEVACPNPTGTWHTTAFVRETNSTTMRIYIDGSVSVSGAVATTNLSLSSTPVSYVGDSTYGSAWNARIKCFIAYNRGLSATEIAQLHAKFI